MNEIRTLLGLELRSFYGINKALHTKDKKAKNRYRLLSIVWIILLGMVFTYVGGLVYGLCYLGLSDIVPAYLTVLSSVLIVAFGIFTAGNRIFGEHGYDILASMPLKPRSIVISRFLGLYTADLLLTIVIMLPGIIVYGVCRQPGIGFYFIGLSGTLLIPAIPLVLSVLCGTFILAISSRMKRKSMIQTVLRILLVVGIMLGSFGMEDITNNFTTEQLTDLAKTIGTVFQSVYPPAIWLNEAMLQADILQLGLFLLVSAAVVVVTIVITVQSFHAIIRRMRSFTAKHNYKIGRMESRGLLKTLYFREAKRYFSSGIYVINTIIGPILGTIMSVALCIVDVSTIKNMLPIAIDIAGLLPFAFSAVFCMMTTTSVSISMEGKQFWIIKSLPIPAKALLNSKLLLNLSLMLPFYLASEIAMSIALKPSLSELIWLLFIPASLILFVVVLGITVNLKFHSFDWEKEEAVVKQSLPAVLGGFAGFFVSLLVGIAVYFIPVQYGDIAKAIICLLLLGSTALLYRQNNKKSLTDL